MRHAPWLFAAVVALAPAAAFAQDDVPKREKVLESLARALETARPESPIVEKGLGLTFERDGAKVKVDRVKLGDKLSVKVTGKYAVSLTYAPAPGANAAALDSALK